MKFLAKCILGIIIFILIYISSAFLLSRIETEREKNSTSDVTIFIKTNGVHTDLVLPIRTELKDWSKEIKFEHTISKDSTVKWVAIGWGDKGFYLNTPTWADLTFTTAFKAAFGLSTTAIHATFYKNMMENESCKRIEISKSQYQRLILYIKNSLKSENNGGIIHINSNANYGKNDSFYEATGTYSLFHTCNTWANNGLKSCGQKASWWTPSDSGIFCHYQ